MVMTALRENRDLFEKMMIEDFHDSTSILRSSSPVKPDTSGSAVTISGVTTAASQILLLLYFCVGSSLHEGPHRFLGILPVPHGVSLHCFWKITSSNNKINHEREAHGARTRLCKDIPSLHSKTLQPIKQFLPPPLALPLATTTQCLSLYLL